jgi:hypothetical protein
MASAAAYRGTRVAFQQHAERVDLARSCQQYQVRVGDRPIMHVARMHRPRGGFTNLLAGWRISVLKPRSTERPEEPNMAAAANKSLVRAFVDAWHERELDRFDDLMAESCRLTVGGATIGAARRRPGRSPSTGWPASPTTASSCWT